jgi:hypothetical protein
MCAHKQKFILTFWALNCNGSAIFKIYISSTWCSASILKEISRNFVLSIYIICIKWKFQTRPPDRSYVVILIKQYKTKQNQAPISSHFVNFELWWWNVASFAGSSPFVGFVSYHCPGSKICYLYRSPPSISIPNFYFYK